MWPKCGDHCKWNKMYPVFVQSKTFREIGFGYVCECVCVCMMWCELEHQFSLWKIYKQRVQCGRAAPPAHCDLLQRQTFFFSPEAMWCEKLPNHTDTVRKMEKWRTWKDTAQRREHWNILERRIRWDSDREIRPINCIHHYYAPMKGQIF